MALKKELALSIVADFHSVEAAAKAAEDWAKQFQKGGVPDKVEEVVVNFADVRWSPDDPEDRAVSPDGFVGFGPAGMGPVHLGVRLDRLLVKCGLADSVSDAVRKLKAGSVRILDQSTAGLEYVEKRSHIPLDFPGSSTTLMLRVGRKVKMAVISKLSS
jgi:tyrosyl-tRNA synthetase